MATLSSILPKPRQPVESTTETTPNYEKQINQLVSTRNANRIPPYGQRKSFRPRYPEDYGNGGAFPEIHMLSTHLIWVATKAVEQPETSGGALTLQVDADGNVKYDAIARQGHNDNRIVHTSLKDVVPIIERKDVDVEKLTMDSTPAKKKCKRKIAAAQPKNVVKTSGGTNKDPTYIRYTPAQSQSSDTFNSGIPMAPPSFLHKKVPRGPPSPPAPVMHSPPKKLTAKEQAEWVIPPCISNWKNTKGYTIPLDKRLAADGRGLQELTINDNFAKFSEALYAADRHAREEVRQRNLMQQKLAQKQKETEEEKLRNLAQKAREERSGLKPASSAGASADLPVPSNRPTAASLMPDYDSSDESGSDRSDDESSHDSDSNRRARGRRDSDEAKARERDQLRRERQKQRERELRMNKMGTEAKAKHIAREQGRDISEKIALGLAKPTLSKESMYDARLFNQSEGINSGFKDDESYSLYDKPLFAQQASSIYKFKGKGNSDVLGSTDADDIEQSIKQDKFGIGRKGFQGAEGGEGSSGPVEFEKETIGGRQKAKDADKDVFGLDTFLNKAKKGKRAREDDGSDDEDRRKR
ncbi:SKIP/SNW domain-containing protein [Phycomyces blakesleeanus]|uniref:Pre-mRNA-processing protein 45 n=1 Tax=Phycomyces blakesleeanus TaxID=4837 RepID=A0ABR3B2B2_PHYBL